MYFVLLISIINCYNFMFLANDCLSSLAGSLKSYFGVHCVAIVSFVNNQFVESPLTCITHMTSVIALIRQVKYCTE